MRGNLPVRAAAPRIIHYPDPANRAPVRLYTDTDVAAYRREQLARRREQELLYLRWVLRQEEIAAQDRKTRRFFWGLGLVVGSGLLMGLAIAGWFIYKAVSDGVQAVHHSGIGIAALILIPLGLLAMAGVGRKCITVVQHWH
jgi:hypothetical protein